MLKLIEFSHNHHPFGAKMLAEFIRRGIQILFTFVRTHVRTSVIFMAIGCRKCYTIENNSIILRRMKVNGGNFILRWGLKQGRYIIYSQKTTQPSQSDLVNSASISTCSPYEEASYVSARKQDYRPALL
jgi:hypothetical protein